MSEYNDVWLMHILLIDLDKTGDYGELADYLTDELRTKSGDRGLKLNQAQKLTIAKYLISKRELDDAHEFVESWSADIVKGVSAKDAVKARLRTAATNELADALGVPYGAVYNSLLGKLKKFEEHEGLKELFDEYKFRVEYIEDHKKRKKELVKEGEWRERDIELEPITEEDLLKFEFDNIWGLRNQLKMATNEEDRKRWTGHIEETERHVAEFKRWLTGEDRELFA